MGRRNKNVWLGFSRPATRWHHLVANKLGYLNYYFSMGSSNKQHAFSNNFVLFLFHPCHYFFFLNWTPQTIIMKTYKWEKGNTVEQARALTFSLGGKVVIYRGSGAGVIIGRAQRRREHRSWLLGMWGEEQEEVHSGKEGKCWQRWSAGLESHPGQRRQRWFPFSGFDSSHLVGGSVEATETQKGCSCDGCTWRGLRRSRGWLIWGWSSFHQGCPWKEDRTGLKCSSGFWFKSLFH